MLTDEQILLRLCAEVQKCDDALGKRSDHEGTEAGPTWYLYHLGSEKFARICVEQIEQHQAAVKIWRKLKRFNERRKS